MSEKADNLQNKLDTFSYMIGRFIDWEEEIRKEKEEKETSSEEILEGFSQTRLMKLLYFTCLASFEDKEDKKDIGLFSIFNNFEAYPKGPVEVDVYSNRSGLPGFEYNGFYLEKLSEDEAVKISINESVENSIKNAITFLKQRKDSFNMLDTDFLVELSHKLPLWSMAYFSTSNQLNIKNIEYLSIERKRFNDLIKVGN